MKNLLSPKDLGAAIGVSESSLKRWADSGRLQVARTAGGHRRIQLAEAIRFIRDSGFSVQRPDLLGLDDMAAVDRGAIGEDSAEQFHQALLDGRAEVARGLLVGLYVEGMPLAQAIDRIVAPAIARIGELWEHAPEGIYIEHRATDICIQALNRVRGLVAATESQPIALGGAPADDPYTLPSLMAASVLATEHWSEVNLGAQTPVDVLARAAIDAEARLVWLALATRRSPAANASLVEELVSEMRRAGSRASVVVGGPALRDDRHPVPGGAWRVASMAELAAFARGLRTAGPDSRTAAS